MSYDILNIFDNKHYSNLAKSNTKNYIDAKPYPHIVFDNFLPDNIVKIISSEYPDLDKINDSWKYHNHQYANRYLLEDTTLFSDNLKLFSFAISSRSFLLFLETLTGNEALLSDPYYLGGGAMITQTGGYLNVHVDFNWHQKLQAWRKCNVLFYLTPDWDESYKGNLELWSIDGKEKIKEVSPIFNRVVVFDTTSKSYHGQPEPIKNPNNIPRRVFSAFYYSTIKNEDTDSAPHYTKYSDDKRNQKANFKTSPYAEKIKQDYLKN